MNKNYYYKSWYYAKEGTQGINYFRDYNKKKKRLCVYKFEDINYRTIYIGSSDNIYNRAKCHLSGGSNLHINSTDLVAYHKFNRIMVAYLEDLNRADAYVIENILVENCKDKDKLLCKRKAKRDLNKCSKTLDELIEIASKLKWEEYSN